MIAILVMCAIASVISWLIAGWLSVGHYDILIISIVLAPLSLLSWFHSDAMEFGGQRSVFFLEYHSAFRLATTILSLAMMYGLYKYFGIYGFWKMLAAFIAAIFVQAPFYALLKVQVWSEIFLYPISVLGLALFYLKAAKI